MKYYKLLLSLLLVFVLSFGVFSIGASAEEIDGWSLRTHIYTTPGNSLAGYTYLSTVGPATEQGYSLIKTYTATNFTTTNMVFAENLELRAEDQSVLLEKDKKAVVTIDNIYLVLTPQVDLTSDIEEIYSPNSVRKVQLILTFDDDSSQSITLDNTCWAYNSLNKTHSVSFEVEPKKNVRTMEIVSYYGLSSYGGSQTFSKYYIHFGYGNKGLGVHVDVETKEETLLGGILGKITDLWKTAEAGFANIVKGITELPQKLWDLISEGLKGLFVPDEQYMADYSDNWDDLLSQRFGAIYQVGSIISDFASNIQAADETNTVYMPSVSLNSVGIPFSFGGQDVTIVPSGFESIVEVVKKIISIVCTFLFINGLRKRYDEIMGVEQ